MIKKLTFIALLLLIAATTFGQLTAPDFTLTDTKDSTYNLYEELEKGKSVILAFFQINCQSCQESVPELDSIWQANDGYQGNVWVWGIESYEGTTQQIEEFMTTFGGTYPAFPTWDDPEVLELYDILWTPQYVTICPDKMMKNAPLEAAPVILENCQPTTGIGHAQQANSRLCSVYPNGRQLSVNFYNAGSQPVTISLIDILGRQLYTRTITGSGSQHLNIPAQHFASQGIVLIKMESGGRIVETQKVFTP